jgi:hypothetical protein
MIKTPAFFKLVQKTVLYKIVQSLEASFILKRAVKTIKLRYSGSMVNVMKLRHGI